MMVPKQSQVNDSAVEFAVKVSSGGTATQVILEEIEGMAEYSGVNVVVKITSVHAVEQVTKW